MVFFWPSLFSYKGINNPKKNSNYPVTNFNKENDSENFNFQGIDDFDQPFYLHAKKYQIINNEKNKFFFQKPKAEINLKEGKWVTLVAKKGIFDIEKKTLELIDNVLVLHSDGQQISTDTAIIDMTKGEFYGSRDLFGTSDKIKFNSEGFNVEKKTGKISLFGKSKIKIKIPSKAGFLFFFKAKLFKMCRRRKIFDGSNKQDSIDLARCRREKKL